VTDTSELGKMLAVQKDSQTIGEFLEWATSEGGYNFTKTVTVKAEGYSLIKDETYEYDTEVERPVKIEEALAHFFGIDLKKAEAEKRAVLDEVRAKQSGS
jgi:hypothetical protein